MKKKTSAAASKNKAETTQSSPPPTDAAPAELERAIGQQVREYRLSLGNTVAELARSAGVSPGMLSKIENGLTSPSLATLRALSSALNVPVTALFRRFEEKRDASFVRAGEGLPIERRGSRSGHEYRLLGHSIGQKTLIEPYLVTLTSDSEVFPLFQHSGQEFLYLLSGEARYRVGSQIYHMRPGDSLFFDADAPHGPEELLKLPVELLSFMVRTDGTEG